MWWIRRQSRATGTCRGVYDLNTLTTDEALLPTRGGDWYDGGLWQGLFLHDWGVNNDVIAASWEYLYKVIVLSNKSIERLTELQNRKDAPAELKNYVAEVRAFRAMYYYYLLDMFGRCAFGVIFVHPHEGRQPKRT